MDERAGDDPKSSASPSEHDLESRLAEVFCRLDEGATLEEAIAPWPDDADVLRRRVELLQGIGLDQMSDPKPKPIPGYRMEHLLGRGGMGEVWLAVDLKTDQQVALKLMKSVAGGAEARARFAREAETLAQLDHPGIVKILATDEFEGTRWIAMEYVDGQSLDEWIRNGIEIREATKAVRDTALALAVAHQRGLVHRDVKPQNIQITADGRVVLIDFGLTRGFEPSSLSKTGGFVGTPHYAAPEQVRGDQRSVGPHSDVYGLGVTLYEALTGKRPFQSSSVEGLFFQILNRDPVPLRKLDGKIPRDLETVVGCAIEKRPQDRYPTAGEMAADLTAVIELGVITARPPAWPRRVVKLARQRPAVATGLIMVVLALLSTIGFELWRGASETSNRKERARHLIASATQRLDQWQEESRDLPQRLFLFESESREFRRQHNSPERIREFNQKQRELESSSARRDQVFAEIADLIRVSQELDRDVAGARRLRARLDVERWRLARMEQDDETADFFAGRVLANDEAGDLRKEVTPVQVIDIITDPPGARVDVFSFRRHDHVFAGGEPRLVCVPHGDLEHAGSGSFAWKVRRGGAGLMPEDLIIVVDAKPAAKNDRPITPGTPIVVWRNGEKIGMKMPADALLRPTRSPLFHGPSSLVGTTPIRNKAVAGDRQVALIRKDGYEPVRLAVPWSTVDAGPYKIKLVPLGRHPGSFVRACDYYRDPRFYMDREVTCGEYLYYLNSAETKPLIDVGRVGIPAGWFRDEEGRVGLPADIDPSFPAHNVSWEEAVAYADWRSACARREGAPYRFKLPSWTEWQARVRADQRFRWYPWGRVFRASYTKSCFSVDKPRLEPVLSYAVDETILGLHDNVGSVSELCDGWFWQERGERPVCGGSWVYANPMQFEMVFVAGIGEKKSTNFIGFRLELVDDAFPPQRGK